MVHVFCVTIYSFENLHIQSMRHLFPSPFPLQALQDMDKVFQKAQNLAQMLLKAAADWKQLVLLLKFNVLLQIVWLQYL